MAISMGIDGNLYRISKNNHKIYGNVAPSLLGTLPVWPLAFLAPCLSGTLPCWSLALLHPCVSTPLLFWPLALDR